MLERGDDNYNQRKLRDELEAVAAGLQAELDQRLAEQPEILSQEKDEAGTLMDERAELKARLRFLAADPDAGKTRKDIAFRILEITRRLDDIFNTREFYSEHGYLPTGKLELGDDPVTLKARQLTLRTYVCKYKRLAKDGAKDKREGFEAKLKQYTAELAITEKKLEGFK